MQIAVIESRFHKGFLRAIKQWKGVSRKMALCVGDKSGCLEVVADCENAMAEILDLWKLRGIYDCNDLFKDFVGRLREWKSIRIASNGLSRVYRIPLLYYAGGGLKNPYNTIPDLIKSFETKQIYKVRCNKCGAIQYADEVGFRYKKSRTCYYCNHSYVLEDYVHKFLKLNGYDYDFQISFDNLQNIDLIGRKMSYDFGIYKDGKICCLIECQGKQHYQPVDFFGGSKAFEKQVEHDKLKQEYARLNGYDLIEVPYTLSNYQEVERYLNQSGLQVIDKQFEDTFCNFLEKNQSVNIANIITDLHSPNKIHCQGVLEIKRDNDSYKVITTDVVHTLCLRFPEYNLYRFKENRNKFVESLFDENITVQFWNLTKTECSNLCELYKQIK